MPTKKVSSKRIQGWVFMPSSAIIVDKAEPSEALKVILHGRLTGEPAVSVVLLQLKRLQEGLPIREEVDVRGEKALYFIHTEISPIFRAEKQRMIIADVNKNHSAVPDHDSIKRAAAGKW